MTWTYRIICDEHGTHRIAEVYTDLLHVEGGIAWTADPIAPVGETPDELRLDLDRMILAFDKPILDEATLRETLKLEAIQAAKHP